MSQQGLQSSLTENKVNFVGGGGNNHTSRGGQPELALTYHLANDFSEWPSWDYPMHSGIYCTDKHTIKGGKHPIVGALYIAQYLFFLVVYLPSLVVISRPPLIKHTCYKLMLVMGILDNCVGSYYGLVAGIFSILGVNYCDNTWLLTVWGHVVHSCWYMYCGVGALLAFNRYVELKSSVMADRLFRGGRIWLWLVPPLIYAIIFSSSWDLPPIYNSQYSAFLFQIDVRQGAPPITNWLCVFNGVWTMTVLVLCYSLLVFELHKQGKKIKLNSSSGSSRGGGGQVRRMESKVFMQCFFICFLLVFVLIIYSISNFAPIPPHLAVFATIAVQLCTGFSSFSYLLFNNAIRNGVSELLCCASIQSKVLPSRRRQLNGEAPAALLSTTNSTKITL